MLGGESTSVSLPAPVKMSSHPINCTNAELLECLVTRLVHEVTLVTSQTWLDQLLPVMGGPQLLHR